MNEIRSVGYNLGDASGRAIAHVLANTCLSQSSGLEVDGKGNHKLLSVNRRFDEVCSDGESALLLFVASLAGLTGVNLHVLLASVDEDHQKVIAEATWLACGYDIALLVAS